MMSKIKEVFPGVSVHGYTATATEQVRGDICKQLALKSPLVLVGNFDRPNLTYRVLPRQNEESQIMQVLDRHRGEAGIIYCMRRRDVDEIHAMLKLNGRKALPYHAGMDGEERKRVQEAFIQEECDLIVATVAFGMGIDRSNIRFIVHASMPKSVEHYQQETGRAGRDGLEAECVLLHSGSDFMSWKRILEKSAQENEVSPDFLPNSLKHLNDMDQYARGGVCRHKALVGYFGQTYAEASCGACDVCLEECEATPDSVVIAQKILSCVARVQERFGVNHVMSVLRGEDTERARSLKHNELSTFGLLKEHSKQVVRDWIRQLIGQGALMQTEDEYPVLKLNLASWEVMKGNRQVRLNQPARAARQEKVKQSRADVTSWEGVERTLFEKLRAWRFDLAKQTGKPPYVIFSDETLRQLARVRPSNNVTLRSLYGIGEMKMRDLGPLVLPIIKQYCEESGLAMDCESAPLVNPAPAPAKQMTATRALAIELFRGGAVIEDVMHQTNKARATVIDYLCDHIRRDKPLYVTAWVQPEVYERVAAAVKTHGAERLKPIFLALEEKVGYDDIRIVVAHLNRDAS
jgi:ATP-dependent DNA helicase RecQ